MRRKISLILITLVALILAACGGEKAQSEGDAGEGEKQTLVVAGYGGNYEEEFKKNIIPAFEEKYNVKVQYITGSSVATLSKLQAQKDNPEIDVAIIDDGPQAQARSLDLIAPLDESIVTNLEKVYDIAKMPDNLGVGFSFVEVGLAYNAEVFEQNNWEPLKSWNDLADPKYKGKLVLPSVLNTFGVNMLVMLAKVNGGDETNIDPGFEKLAEVAKNTVNFDDTADVSNYFVQGQTVASVWGTGRIYTLQDTGFPIEYVSPEEGAVPLIVTVSVVKNASNQELAQQFVNFLLDVEIQEMSAIKRFEGPVNMDVELSDEVAEKVPYGQERIEKLIKVDWDVINANRTQWNERWDKEIIN
ncbi:ABC transporter substrate-binding protein [Oceanobacillus zhaokaii]|uniref:ABC transporter substrate-binding protein n=1 Tax=Oceanobacillus zhaokaii TaxID=2052660 RepID=A0A345PK76_9BACI|nr:ABC transporter substrate-binding protein [Oceanobacillus zhaokaii]AXI10406.1 ABC transporter substrate-binding protein [Oceanobacillus zhaokaii]